MNVIRIIQTCVVAALLFDGSSLFSDKAVAAEESDAAADQGVQVLTRGPVHEAFAETISFNPEPGIVVPKAPPDSINEVVPDERPEGASVVWIPGYWAWNDESGNFLWVSGIWRKLPPGRQWITGYWSPTAQRSQWTPGYWADTEASEIQYLPEPPQTAENGPDVGSPSADSTWIPGCWIWQEDRYAWSRGSWARGQQDWEWTPSYYTWTPRGYVFVDGYWDYSIARRGVMFAPVQFNDGVYSQPGFSYSPSTVINPAVFATHLFLRPSYGHYYFGDYYDQGDSSAGFFPSFSYQSSHFGYDPFFAHERWQNRRDPNWQQRNEANFRDFRTNKGTRPPRTLAAQAALAARATRSDGKGFMVAAPLEGLAKSKENTLRLRYVNKAEHQQFDQRRQESRQFLEQRQQTEARAENTVRSGAAMLANPATAQLPKSPFSAGALSEPGSDDAPPKRYEVLKPDFTVEPQPRRTAGPQGKLQNGSDTTASETAARRNIFASDRNKAASAVQRDTLPGDQPKGELQGASNGSGKDVEADPPKSPTNFSQRPEYKAPDVGLTGGKQNGELKEPQMTPTDGPSSRASKDPQMTPAGSKPNSPTKEVQKSRAGNKKNGSSKDPQKSPIGSGQKVLIERWRRACNTVRPHSLLGY